MWYAVSLFYRGEHLGSSAEEDFWEESIILVEAGSNEEAKQRATDLAEESFSYVTGTGDELHWSFDSVLYAYEISSEVLGHGVELFSRFMRSREVESLKTPFAD